MPRPNPDPLPKPPRTRAPRIRHPPQTDPPHAHSISNHRSPNPSQAEHHPDRSTFADTTDSAGSYTNTKLAPSSLTVGTAYPLRPCAVMHASLDAGSSLSGCGLG